MSRALPATSHSLIRCWEHGHWQQTDLLQGPRWSNPGKWPGFFTCKITWRWLGAWNKITCMKPLAYKWNAQHSLNMISLYSYYFTLLHNRGKWGSYPRLGMKTWADGTLRRQWAPWKWRPCQPRSLLHQAHGQLWSWKASLGFPGGLVSKESPAMQETASNTVGPGFSPCVGKIPWRRKRQPIPVLLPGKSHGQRSLADYSPWGHKYWTQLNN